MLASTAGRAEVVIAKKEAASGVTVTVTEAESAPISEPSLSTGGAELVAVMMTRVLLVT
jgi:hypothetical protein